MSLRLFAFVLGLFSLNVSYAAIDAPKLFTQHCASCHGADRLGGMGPALLPENLERLRRPEAVKTIGEGRAATQMPAFGEKLSKEEIQALADYIYTPPKQEPVWGANEIRHSRIENFAPGSLPDKPVFKADPLNLFVVVETGDHHATILDGDKFEPIYRFQTRFALHGGPKFSHDGRYVYFASRDGWISKFDIYNLKIVAEIRAGINTRNLAVSGDGKYVLVGNYLPHTLVLLDASDLSLMRVIPVAGENGQSSRVSAVYQAEPRQSFIVALKDVPEVWEISYREPAAAKSTWRRDYDPANQGMTVETRQFPIRRIRAEDYLDDFFFDPSYRHLVATARNAKKGEVLDLDSGKVVAEVDLPGMPHLASAITWDYKGHTVFATPNLKEGMVSVIDMDTWKTVKHIKTLGPGFFMRSHENSPYAWVDVFFGPNKGAMQVIDKKTLEIVATLRPAPGKISAHVEFTRDGRYALVSVWDMDGAIVVYDARTLKEIKRIPMKKPSGKYNVYNKTHLSSGTSH
ncbi:MAG: cytochrome D1 domain-containing protein [Burkholderiales bacterium]